MFSGYSIFLIFMPYSRFKLSRRGVLFNKKDFMIETLSYEFSKNFQISCSSEHLFFTGSSRTVFDAESIKAFYENAYALPRNGFDIRKKSYSFILSERVNYSEKRDVLKDASFQNVCV